MEQNQFPRHFEAATDEPASPFNPPLFEPPPLLSDCLDDAIAETLDATFTPDTPRPRHDGWTAEAIAAFLRQLAAGGVVEHAARAAGLSAAAAYAFRNRRQGRAFAKMWDAVLVHRTRARIASELQGRAIAGCVSVRKRDGVVIGEYHYHDNRLAMAMLTRLDRIAEREAPCEAHLRALSEDMEDFLDCLAGGGDADAFVAARQPVVPEPEAPPRPDDDPELTRFAHMAGCHDYRDVDPREIDVRDLDPARTADWDDDQWVRAFRSGFMTWLEIRNGAKAPVTGPGSGLRFMFMRNAVAAADRAGHDPDISADDEAEIDTSDLDTAEIWDWTDDQLARAYGSGFLGRLPDEFWDRMAEAEEEG